MRTTPRYLLAYSEGGRNGVRSGLAQSYLSPRHITLRYAAANVLPAVCSQHPASMTRIAVLGPWDSMSLDKYVYQV